ncbi:10332_t:CDS:2, partial [Scutellospora calospora]
KHLFDKLESDHGLEGIVGYDLIGEEIKSLDLQFHSMSISLFDEDFNKASSTKNNLSKSTESKPSLAQEESKKNNVKYSIDASSNSDTSDSNSSNSSISSSEIEVTHTHKTRAVKNALFESVK